MLHFSKRIAFITAVTLSAFVVLAAALTPSCFLCAAASGQSYEKSIPDNIFSSENSEVCVVGAGEIADKSGEISQPQAYGDEQETVRIGKGGTVSYNLTVKKMGKYNILLKYLIPGDADVSLKLTFDNDGIIEEKRIILTQMWTDSGAVRTDDFGNQFSPDQERYGQFYTAPVCEDDQFSVSPIEFDFGEGNQKITLSGGDGDFLLCSVSITPVCGIQTYEETEKTYKSDKAQNYEGKTVVVQGEDAVLKSSRSLIGKSDSSSSDVYPSSASNSLINYIGDNWSNPRQEIIWTVDVPESGLYKIGINYKQDKVINGYSYRCLKIDGKIPFSEAKDIGFFYGNAWRFYEVGNGEAPYSFYLSKGQHTLSLTAVMGENEQYYLRLKKMISTLGDLYLKIIMITGETPDANRDYDLFKQIPDFSDCLSQGYQTLKQLSADMQEKSGGRTGQYIAAINNMARVLKSMSDNPYVAQDYVGDYYTQYTTLSSWLNEMKSMPLYIDQIQLASPKQEFEYPQKGFFQSALFSLKRIVASFSDDYNRVSNSEKDGTTLKIWVNWGRDQAQVLNNLIQEDFTKYAEAQMGCKVNVNVELTAASLVNGILSGIQPDLQLHMPRTEPVNLAMRGALYNLEKFDDYKDVLSRFNQNAELPYYYGNGLFAIPDQQSFYIMFYRSDILKSLGIDIPQTWDDFLKATAIIQRNNMQVYLPPSNASSMAGIGSCGIFTSILQQRGGSLYNKSFDASMLDSAASISAFTFWTDMFTQYKIPTTQNFYNRFRVGLCPLGIETYNVFTTLTEAAPEIEGRWGIAVIPGTQKKDGTIDHTVTGSGTGCGILQKSQHKKEAWCFIKWWTGEDIQLKYNNGVESVLGPLARITTANVQALKKMSWNENAVSVLSEQCRNVTEIREIPGGYYLTRALDQAYWAVIGDETDNPKDAIVKWNEIANNEIKRKISEYTDRSR